MNIYQPAQSAVTGILAPVNFANTVEFICGAMQAASRLGSEQSAKLCVQYLAPIIKNRQYNFPPLGRQPVRRAPARPNEITYSEDRLRPDLPPPPPRTSRAADAGHRCPPKRRCPVAPPPAATPTDPGQGLEGLMVPGGTP